MSERNLDDAAAQQLQEAGFFVERNVHPVGIRKRSGGADVVADLLAWAGDDSGELVPEAVVEVKTKRSGTGDGALAQLSRVAAVLGARRAFLLRR